MQVRVLTMFPDSMRLHRDLLFVYDNYPRYAVEVLSRYPIHGTENRFRIFLLIFFIEAEN